jgi:stress responsive alpha/beta barrel protein
MIRNVVLFSVKDGTRLEQVEAIERAMKAITFTGCSRWEMGRDLNLRAGNMPYAFIAEFVDEAAYRAYDANEEHNRIRRELLAPIVERIERFQYVVGAKG